MLRKRLNIYMSEIVSLEDRAVAPLIEAIECVAVPAPIFGNSAVANLPLFSMQALCKLEPLAAVPAPVDYIPKYENDAVLSVNGKEWHPVVETLATITKKDFGTDQAAWRRWWQETKAQPPATADRASAPAEH